mgnify:CR=1 FL=1
MTVDKSCVETTPCESSDEEHAEIKTNISNKKTKTIISADHGLVNINKECRHHLSYGDDIQIYGDQLSVYINGSKASVLETFSEVPGVLLEQDELSYLLGRPTNEFLKSIYPDFCFLVEDKNIIYPKHLSAQLKGYHGGLSREELQKVSQKNK